MKSALYYAGYDDSQNQYQPHFLDSCSLCQRTLAHNSDIFMYRGNTPFCSQECRQEQIEIDEAKDRRRNRSNRKTTDSRNDQSVSNETVRTGAVAVS